MINGIATVRMTLKAGWKPPRGRRSATAASGTNTSSSLMVCEPVARIPMVRQSSMNVMPSDLSGTGKCKTWGPCWGSSKAADVTSTSPFGDPLANGLTAVTLKPPSTRLAVPLDSSQSLAPVLTRIASLAATFSRSGLPGRPARSLATAAETRC